MTRPPLKHVLGAKLAPALKQEVNDDTQGVPGPILAEQVAVNVPAAQPQVLRNVAGPPMPNTTAAVLPSSNAELGIGNRDPLYDKVMAYMAELAGQVLHAESPLVALYRIDGLLKSHKGDLGLNAKDPWAEWGKGIGVRSGEELNQGMEKLLGNHTDCILEIQSHYAMLPHAAPSPPPALEVFSRPYGGWIEDEKQATEWVMQGPAMHRVGSVGFGDAYVDDCGQRAMLVDNKDQIDGGCLKEAARESNKKEMQVRAGEIVHISDSEDYGADLEACSEPSVNGQAARCDAGNESLLGSPEYTPSSPAYTPSSPVYTPGGGAIEFDYGIFAP